MTATFRMTLRIVTWVDLQRSSAAAYHRLPVGSHRAGGNLAVEYAHACERASGNGRRATCRTTDTLFVDICPNGGRTFTSGKALTASARKGDTMKRAVMICIMAALLFATAWTAKPPVPATIFTANTAARTPCAGR